MPKTINWIFLETRSKTYPEEAEYRPKLTFLAVEINSLIEQELYGKHKVKKKDLKIFEEQVKKICGLGKGVQCCRYLIFSIEGWCCAKNTSLKTYIDQQVVNGNLVAQGPGCEKEGVKPKEN